MSDHAIRRQRWFTLREIAELGLDGIPGTREGVRQMAEQEGWSRPALEGFAWRRRTAQGGGREYSVRVLPVEAQMVLVVRHGGPHLVSLLAALCAKLGVKP